MTWVDVVATVLLIGCLLIVLALLYETIRHRHRRRQREKRRRGVIDTTRRKK